MQTWNVFTYDVWGNDEDGFEVNDRYDWGSVKLPEDAPGKVVIQTIKDFGIFAQDALAEEFKIDGDGSIMVIEDARNDCPLCELILEDG